MEENNNIVINQVDPTTFEYQQYTEKDTVLISSSRLDTVFSSSTDYIEYYAYAQDRSLIFPSANSVPSVFNNTNYQVINGDVLINPVQDLENLGYDQGIFFSTYNFYRKRLFSDINRNYYIDEISSDRTEVRLKSSVIDNEVVIASTEEFINYREEQDYFVDFYLNFGADQQVICNNIALDTQLAEPSVLVKLYEPLPVNFSIKDQLWIVEEISAPQAYSVNFPIQEFIPDDFEFISGPNYSLQAVQQTGESNQEINFDTLLNSNVTSSTAQLKNLLDRKEINISVDYTDYSNFVYFSSALTRLENFYYKVGLIQSSSAEIENLPTASATYSASKAELTTSIDTIIKNFDGYEYFLYYDSGSQYSYPKSNTEPPYILFPTSSATVLSWLGSADPNSAYYGGQALSASNYDGDNDNYLYYAIPEYLRDDSDNQKYILFVDMVAQQYDNSWLYTKNITTRFDADNRLNFGISKDLVADAIRDFGVKLYSNNFNVDDLYTAFLGITPSGSAFPFPNITGSFPAPSGFEFVDTEISASNDIVPLDDVNKSLYKRIYHNIPYLLKTKGTLAGLKALITSYGVPDTILRVNEFGGKDRNDFRDWDYEQNVFNYALALNGENSHLSSSFETNPKWPNYAATDKTPRSVQFRFKTPGIPTASAYYNLAVGNVNKWFITLDYTGSGLSSGSYSGSVASASNAYGTLRYYPDGTNDTSVTASVTLPFFDGGWWSVMATIDYDALNTGSLFAANRIDDKVGFSGSDSIGATTQLWKSTDTAFFPSSSGLVVDTVTYLPLTGALQEVRYWDEPLSESLFYDYVMNPYSTQGNTINSTPESLIFRADLGTELNTGSRVSIHPKVTGSWATTQSFDGNSDFYISGSFISNTESIYLNQVPGGIKNRISDKIRIDEEVLPTGSTLSPYRSVQQETYPSGSNPSVNYLEVAFSPTDQVNDDIIAQIGAFNLGDYIGDPRQISESGVTYPQLDTLRDAYFTKYINSYDVNDFVRLIKFFDNSLFKMIEDFTPARTTLSSGVVVKQNLLERNRQAPPSMSFTTPEYTGSVKSFARDYQVPNSSTSFPQDSTISGSSIEVFSGGTGGVFEPYNSIFAAPISTSNAPICIDNYIYSSSFPILGIQTASGHWTLNEVDVTNSTNTMSISISSSNNEVNLELFSLLSSSAGQGSDSFITAYPSASQEGTNIVWKIDRGLYFSGYGGDDDVYGQAPYGDYSQLYQFYLTVHENNLGGAIEYFGDLDVFKLCFQQGGVSYSGVTAAQVSASSLFKTYPDFQQSFTESIVPSLGITPAYPQQHSSSNHLAPVTIQRIDQREFYNGEFGGAIPVGPTDICSAFFGQDAIIDYFFYIQWFTADTFDENAFLTSSNLPLAGNVWFWTDVSGSTFTGIPEGQELTITQQPFSGYPGTSGQGQGNLTASFSQDSTSGTGTGLVIGVTQSFIGSGPSVQMEAFVEATGSGYAVNDTITINSTTLNDSVFSGLLQDVIAPITTQPYSGYPGQSGQGNPPITAQISTTSTSGTGTGIVLGVTQSFINTGPSIQLSAVIEATGSNYAVNDTVTITQATLNSAGFSAADQDAVFTLNSSVFTSPTADQNLIITLGANDIITTTSSISNKVKYIKMSNVDANGESILPFITDSEYVTFNLTGAQDYLGNLIEGFQTWYISNTGTQDDNDPNTVDATLIIVDQIPSSDAVNSYDTQFYDLSFSASGVYSYYATSSGDDPNVLPDTGFTASAPQGYFPPVNNFPTESFFRGWGKSNYFEGNEDGTVYRVETGSGFSSDTLGNFNTGSVEMDFDSSIPYTASKIPWFINAPATTRQVLSNSSLVGDLGATDLQLYTGSITASAVPLGPAFNILTAVTPTEDTTIITEPITIPIFAPIIVTCNPLLLTFQDSGNFPGGVAVPIQTDSPSRQWQASVEYDINSGFSNWVNLSTTAGTGTQHLDVTVDDGPEPGGTQTINREATLVITAVQGFGQPAVERTCLIRQAINTSNGYIPMI